MSKSLMIQEDVRRIEILKQDFGIQTKIDVIRAALDLLEKEAERLKKIKRWKHATKLVSKNSSAVNKNSENIQARG